MQTLTREQFLNHLIELGKTTRQRQLVAVAGAPGSGKSTLSEWLIAEINKNREIDIAAIVPQDGFHFDNAVLESRNQLAVKGAPDTLDIAGLEALLIRLKTEKEIAVPVFDRTLEISRNCARIISASHKLVLVEGNYLLLENHPLWRRLKPLFDDTVFLETPLPELRRRLEKRWIDQGLAMGQVRDKVESNDLINAETVVNHSCVSDFIVRFEDKQTT